MSYAHPELTNGWIKASQDDTYYDSCIYPLDTPGECANILTDANELYEAYLRSKQNSSWKGTVQGFEIRLLNNIALIQDDFEKKVYELSPTNDFILNERGKIRYVSGENIRDRIPKHVICDKILSPELRNYIIYDNGASIKDRGMSHTRKRIETHLHQFYAHHGNKGYVLLIDFSKYYDNIRHDVLYHYLEGHISDEITLWFLTKILQAAEIDVSYMSDDEYADCMNQLFNSLDYHKISKRLLTGDKMMAKHLNIGDQVAQIAGIIYPIPIDNYIKIVKQEKYYARYMDDSYIIHESKEHLEQLLQEIIVIAEKLGITVNTNKTRIVKVSDYWRFLQIQYSLTDTGRVIHKINNRRVHKMRKKLRKLTAILDSKEFDNYFKSWYNNQKRWMSRRQRKSMYDLFYQLKEEKYSCTQSHLLTGRSSKTSS